MLVKMLAEGEEEPLGSSKSDFVAKVWKHLDSDAAESISRALSLNGSTEVWKLEDLSPANLPCRRAFQLSDCHSISFPLQRLPERQDHVVEEESKGMPKSKLMKPA